MWPKGVLVSLEIDHQPTIEIECGIVEIFLVARTIEDKQSIWQPMLDNLRIPGRDTNNLRWM